MSPQPATILVVEDDPVSRKLIRTILTGRGYRLQEAEDLDQARDFLAHTVPELVLLDMRLKGRDGLELVHHIRATPLLRDVPIAAVTASAMPADEDRAIAAGIDLYLSKPIDTRRLPQLVDELITKRRERSDAG
jgi:CheY-like chemotaxis protein